MFHIAVVDHRRSTSSSGRQLPPEQSSSLSSSSQPNSGSVRSGSSSGPMPLKQPTGPITSGSLSSGNLRTSDQLGTTTEDGGGSGKVVYGAEVTNLSGDGKVGIRVSRGVVWVALAAIAMIFLIGAFFMVAVKTLVILVGVAAVIATALLRVFWNCLPLESFESENEKFSLESLPKDMLVEIICCVNHNDLKQLFHVSTTIREAAMVAKDTHFYRTPAKKALRIPEFDHLGTPNAPKRPRLHRSKLYRNELASVSMALFTSPKKVPFMKTEL